MPPQAFESDSDAEPVKGRAAADDVEEMDEDVEADEEGEGDEGDDGEDEYVVEAIKDHKFEGKVSFHQPGYPTHFQLPDFFHGTREFFVQWGRYWVVVAGDGCQCPFGSRWDYAPMAQGPHYACGPSFTA